MAASPDSIPTRTSSGSASPSSSHEAASAPADRQAGAHRAERVVLVHLRQPEDGHHRVADELLGPAAERLQLLDGGVEEPPEDLARALGVQALREPGGVHQVGEQHRDHLAFLGPERVATTAPQLGQKRAPGGSGWPQTGNPSHQHRRGPDDETTSAPGTTIGKRVARRRVVATEEETSMAIKRMNHAVLYVRAWIERSRSTGTFWGSGS